MPVSRVGIFAIYHVEDVMSRDRFERHIETTENPVVEHNGHSAYSTLLPSGVGRQPEEPTMPKPKLTRDLIDLISEAGRKYCARAARKGVR